MLNLFPVDSAILISDFFNSLKECTKGEVWYEIIKSWREINKEQWAMNGMPHEIKHAIIHEWKNLQEPVSTEEYLVNCARTRLISLRYRERTTRKKFVATFESIVARAKICEGDIGGMFLIAAEDRLNDSGFESYEEMKKAFLGQEVKSDIEEVFFSNS